MHPDGTFHPSLTPPNLDAKCFFTPKEKKKSLPKPFEHVTDVKNVLSFSGPDKTVKIYSVLNLRRSASKRKCRNVEVIDTFNILSSVRKFRSGLDEEKRHHFPFSSLRNLFDFLHFFFLLKTSGWALGEEESAVTHHTERTRPLCLSAEPLCLVEIY